MATTKYILNGNGFVIGEARGLDTLPAGFSAVDLSQDLGELQLYTGTHSTFRYRMNGEQLLEQEVRPYGEINSQGDLVAVHLLGSMEADDPNLIPLSDKQYKDLIRENEDPRDNGLYDPDYNLPRYSVAKKKISKKRNLFDSIDYCNQALNRLGAGVEELIVARYSAGKESKLSKQYLEWIADGQPAKDSREADFKAMQEYIKAARSLTVDAKKKIKKQRDKLQQG